MEYSGGMKQLLPMLLLVFSLGAGAYDEDDLKKLKTNKDCIKCDLSGAYLAGENLSYANLSFADLDRLFKFISSSFGLITLFL